MKLKTGDWGFYEFRVATVKDVGPYGPTISNGIIEIGAGRSAEEGYGWRPLTLRNAALSRIFGDMSDRLHREGSAGLNYPDFHRHLIDLWAKACDGDDKAADEAAKFVNEVLEADRNRETNAEREVAADDIATGLMLLARWAGSSNFARQEEARQILARGISAMK